MKKRILTLLLALACVLPLYACHSKNDEDINKTPVSSQDVEDIQNNENGEDVQKTKDPDAGYVEYALPRLYDSNCDIEITITSKDDDYPLVYFRDKEGEMHQIAESIFYIPKVENAFRIVLRNASVGNWTMYYLKDYEKKIEISTTYIVKEAVIDINNYDETHVTFTVNDLNTPTGMYWVNAVSVDDEIGENGVTLASGKLNSLSKTVNYNIDELPYGEYNIFVHLDYSINSEEYVAETSYPLHVGDVSSITSNDILTE